ncbi:hypothetical protein [Promicromonospora sp. NPDC023805]|uniref:hypothetical protein n=1 Tax=Promicromonospora sp. NPDC023805 TaxID=3154696 RepID=UPI0033D3E670
MTTAPVPEWPRIEAVARPDGTGELTIDGTSYPVQASTVEEARLAILARIADTAAELQRPVRVLASEPDGQWSLIVHPDGRVQADDGVPAGPAPSAPSPSVFAPSTAGAGAGATSELPATGPADPAVEDPTVEVPAVEKPDTDAWARAARQAQATPISTGPQEITDSAPVNQPASRELPDDDTVVRAHGELVEAAPFELPDDQTVARARSEAVVDATPLLEVPDDITSVRAHGEAVGSAPVFELPDDIKLVRAPGEEVGTAPFLEPPDVDTVVRTHGEAVDDAPAPAEPVVPRRRRPALLAVAVAGAVVLVAAGTFGVVALTGNLPGPGPTAPVDALPGAGATLPVQAPPGFDGTALWSVPVGDEPQILLTPDGGVLAASDGQDTFTIFDRATGTTTWEGQDPVYGLRLSQIGGEPVLAADSPGTLHVWPLKAPDPLRVAPTTIDLGSEEAAVTYGGPAPLIVLPDQKVALLDKKSATVTLEVPDGATPVAATAQHVIAVGPGAWWTIPPDGDPVRKDLPRPKQAVGDPTAAIAVGGNQLAVVWRTKDSAKDVLALVGLDRNTIRASAMVRSSAFPPDAEPLRDRAGSARTIGPVLVDVGPKPVVADLKDMTPEAVFGRTVYGTSQGKPIVATVGPDGVKLKAAKTPGETPGETPAETPAEAAQVAAVTKNIAFVVAPQGDETILYALPRTKAKNP